MNPQHLLSGFALAFFFGMGHTAADGKLHRFCCTDVRNRFYPDRW
jgi:hypothetical protein